jgi:hypothetical protein
MNYVLQMARRKEKSLIDIEKNKRRLKIRNIRSQDSRKDQNLILEKLEELSTKIRKIDNANRERKGIDSKGRVICHECERQVIIFEAVPIDRKRAKRGTIIEKKRKKPTNNTWRRKNHSDQDERWKVSNIME